jgi:5-methylcytosine-specific restriction protein A
MLKHTESAKRFYRTAKWLKCRASYIQSVFGMCEHCDKPGYIVDHIIEINSGNINDPEITLNHDNLQYLCTSCHNKKTFGKAEVTRDDVRFDGVGNLIEK